MTIVDHTPRLGLPVYGHWSEAPWDDARWPDFSPAELACRGTGKLAYQPETLDMLQRLRTQMGRPMMVNSGYRSPEHNRRVGGASTSYHMDGIAYDVSMQNHDPHAYKQAAAEIGFDGIGTYPEARKNFIHVDTRGTPARWGAAFPVAAQPFSAPEPRPEPQAARTGAAIAGGAGVAVAAREVAPTIEAVQGLGEVAQLTLVAGVVALVAALIIWGPDNVRKLWRREEDL